MYINVGKLVFPKSDEIEIEQIDIIDGNDIDEHNFNIKVVGVTVLTLTRRELDTIVEKGGFALRKE